MDDRWEMKGDQGRMRLAARTAARLYKEYVKMQGCVVENWTKTSHERMGVEETTKEGVKRCLAMLTDVSCANVLPANRERGTPPVVAPTSLEIKKGLPKKRKPSAASLRIPEMMAKMPDLLAKYKESRKKVKSPLHEALFPGRKSPKKLPGQ